MQGKNQDKTSQSPRQYKHIHLTNLVIMDNTLWHRFVQHLFVPLLQTFGFGYLLIRRMAVEDVVISFTRWACPDMSSSIPSIIRQKSTCELWQLTLELCSPLPQDGATTKLASVTRWTIITALQGFSSSIHSGFIHAIALPSFTNF